MFLLQTVDSSELVDGEHMVVFLFRVYQSNLEIALPFECVQEVLSALLGKSFDPSFTALRDEDLETLRQFVLGMLVEEELFLRHRVLLKGICAWDENDRDARLRRSEEIYLALQTGAQSYLLRAYCDHGLITRMRTYAQLGSGELVQHLAFDTHWKLRATSALSSYQLLLSVNPGQRIPLSELFRDRFNLTQDSETLNPYSLALSGEVKLSKKKEAV